MIAVVVVGLAAAVVVLALALHRAAARASRAEDIAHHAHLNEAAAVRETVALYARIARKDSELQQHADAIAGYQLQLEAMASEIVAMRHHGCWFNGAGYCSQVLDPDLAPAPPHVPIGQGCLGEPTAGDVDRLVTDIHAEFYREAK